MSTRDTANPTPHARARILGTWIRIPLACLLLLSAVILLVNASDRWIVRPAFDTLQRLQTHEDASRAWRAIQREVTQLSTELADWSNWDDTCAFMDGRDDNYLQANLGDWAVLERTSGIQAILLVETNGHVRYQNAHSSAHGGPLTLDLFVQGDPPPVVKHLTPALRHEAAVEGLLLTPHGIMLFAARPILSTDAKGPTRGVIAFCRFLSPALQNSLVQQTHVPFSLLVRGQSGFQPHEAEILANQTPGVPIFHAQEPGDAVYQVLTDLSGARICLLRTRVRHDISAVGRQTGRVMAIVLILSTMGLAGAAVLLFLSAGGLFSKQTRRNLSDGPLPTRRQRPPALALAASFSLYIIGVAVYAWWSSREAQSDLLHTVDQQLLIAARLQPFLLPADFHDRATAPGAISLEEELALRETANRFIRHTDLAYLYTVVQRDGRLFFTSANTTPEEDAERASWYFHPYEGAPGAFIEALQTGSPTCIDYRDEFGHFRSAIVPQRSPGGNRYLACADYNMDTIQAMGRRRAAQTGLVAMGFLALALPFLLVHRRAFAAFSHDLRASETSYRGLFDTVSEAIYILDDQGRFLTVNRGAEAMYGHPRDWFRGRTPADVSAPGRNDMAATRQALQAALQGQPQRFEFWGLRCDGTTFPKDVRLYRGTYFGRDVVIALAEDTTRRKRAEDDRLDMERRLLHSQKLESLGVLAGGVAHDFNNLLMAMLGNLDIAAADMPAGHTALINLEEAKRAACQAANLTRQLLAYSGKGKFVIQRVNLSDAVRENLHLLRASIAKSATLNVQLANPLSPIEADPAQVQQVVMNLLINAAEAIGEHVGTITVLTGEELCTAESFAGNRTEAHLPPGRYVYLDVADTGCGMDADTLVRIFDPFYSTKATGRGLGMPAVLGIVRAYGGAIRVDSRPGDGARVRIWLPAAAGAAPTTTTREDARAVGKPPVPPAPGGVVLVVDDEDSVRQLCVRMVQRLGYRTLEAANGAEAVACFRTNATHISAVLMDLSMPVMDGATAHAAIRQIRPDATIILSSGYSEQEADAQFTGKGLAGFIQKPYDLAALHDTLLRVITGNPPSRSS